MNKYRSAVLLVVLFTVLAHISSAQTFINTPGDTVLVSGYLEDNQTLTITQTNISNDTIRLKWAKVSETVPANWEASVCDNIVCYVELVDSGEMKPVLPAASTGYLLLHATAHVNYGTAVIRYAVWDEANPLLKDTLTFILVVNPVAGIQEADDKNTFCVFPNPVNDVLYTHSAFTEEYAVKVFNATGEEIYSAVSATGFKLPASNFPTGVYFIQLKSNHHSFTQKFMKL